MFKIKLLLTQVAVIGSCVLVLSGCATVFGGPRTSYQVTKPFDGQPQRQVRVGALIADIILFWPGTIVDFATGAIYKPAPVQVPLAPPPVEMR
ncbi:hypothetical protein [Spirosoma flavum]|uniref:YceK/YidQ family lipoprotein n=1 Tax=Spirosoma flavum TaxID=2048557 RepID=A0ABW6AU29_9BACT